MDNAEVSQNIILAVIASPMIAALVDMMKRRGPAWMNEGMTPALIAEALGVVFGLIAFYTVTPLYSVHGQPPVYPTAPLAYYIATGFVVGLTAVGLQAQFRAAVSTSR